MTSLFRCSSSFPSPSFPSSRTSNRIRRVRQRHDVLLNNPQNTAHIIPVRNPSLALPFLRPTQQVQWSSPCRRIPSPLNGSTRGFEMSRFRVSPQSGRCLPWLDGYLLRGFYVCCPHFFPTSRPVSALHSSNSKTTTNQTSRPDPPSEP
jgi:hypothetical protein